MIYLLFSVLSAHHFCDVYRNSIDAKMACIEVFALACLRGKEVWVFANISSALACFHSGDEIR